MPTDATRMSIPGPQRSPAPVGAQALASRLAELSVDLIQGIRADGTLFYTNPAWRRVLGYSAEAAAGVRLSDVVAAAYHTYCTQCLHRILAGEDIGALDVQFVTRQGETRYLRGHAVAVDAAQAEELERGVDLDAATLPPHAVGAPRAIVGAVLVCRDVTDERDLRSSTERQRAELEELVRARTAQIQQSTSLLTAAFEATADGLLVVDVAGRVSAVNQKFLSMWRIPDDIAASRDDARLLQAVLDQLSDPQAFLDKVRELYAQPTRESFDVLTFLDGRVFERYSRPQVLSGDIVGRVWSFRDVSERTQTMAALEERQRLLSESQRAAGVGTWSLDAETGQVSWTDETFRLCGVSPDTFTPEWEAILQLVHPEDRPLMRRSFRELRYEERVALEFRVPLADGSTRTLLGQGARIQLGGRFRILGTVQDVSRLRALEAQFRQAQKMEGIGRLAGGVAHDFNNLLMTIAGHAELLREQLHLHDPRAASVEVIEQATQRGAALTRQLLAFSRKQVVQPQAVHLNDVIVELVPMLRPLIGEHIELWTELEPGIGAAFLDRSQVDQVVMNLVVNARDAMPDGGRLTIATQSVQPSSAPPAAHLSARRRVRLSVSDTGTGMDAATQAHIFEPFFTTKGPDAGTGLGLATVYGIVAQHDGEIRVHTELGKGTRFDLEFPCIDETAAAVPAPKAQPAPSAGTETILLVEDEANLRALTARFLEREGYSVLQARDGMDALQTAARFEGPIDLVLSDVILPKLSGPALLRQLRALRPQLRVLFVSGYTDDVLLQSGFSPGETSFLQKPYPMTLLLERVRQALTNA